MIGVAAREGRIRNDSLVHSEPPYLYRTQPARQGSPKRRFTASIPNAASDAAEKPLREKCDRLSLMTSTRSPRTRPRDFNRRLTMLKIICFDATRKSSLLEKRLPEWFSQVGSGYSHKEYSITSNNYAGWNRLWGLVPNLSFCSPSFP